MSDCDFDEVKEIFYIECFDYLTGKRFLSKAKYSTYARAQKAISSLVPPSACCGFSIVSFPDLH